MLNKTPSKKEELFVVKMQLPKESIDLLVLTAAKHKLPPGAIVADLINNFLNTK